MKSKILIVDDEEDLTEILQFNLESEGFAIEIANSAEDALKLSIEKFDLILLDIMMGGMSGYKFANKIRKEKGIKTPIIFITAKNTENDLLTGFNVGADDYISKPFSIKEVIARVNAVLLRTSPVKKKKSPKSRKIKIGDLKVDIDRKKVKLDDVTVDMTKKEFEILLLLIQNEGKLYSREDILNNVWSLDVVVVDRTVDVNIARIRKKIGRYGKSIKSRSGYGYYFEKTLENKSMKKYSFRRKLLVYYLSVFVIFLLITGIFQYFREQKYRTGQLETSLNDITEISKKYIDKHKLFQSNNFDLLDSLKYIFPKEDSRVTVIANDGKVLYDSFVAKYDTLENHGSRPEILDAKNNVVGVSIRTSSSTGLEYYYYAKNIDNYFIRSSVIYDVTIVNFLKANSLFFYFIFGLFILVWCVLWLVTRKFAESISKLQNFALSIGNDPNNKNQLDFENDEIGVIGKEIANVYGDLQKTQTQLSVEKERIFRHLNAVNQGIAIFSSKKELLISNQQFIKYANLMSDKSLKSETDIFGLKGFKKLSKFIDDRLDQSVENVENQKVEKQIKVNQGNRYFSAKCIIFIDKSFEIIITNITRKEKNMIIKNQMTSNIAHELKTPVSAIQAYLETIINKPDIDDDKKVYFLQKAYGQAERLGLLINDISTIYKMESTEKVFTKERLNLYDLITEIEENSQLRMEEKNIRLSHDFYNNLVVSANKELMNSIFQNLVDNSIKYAGEDVDINISMYKEDKQYLYFSYSDNGVGIDAEHLDRVFERFYRVDSGRTRKSGGTGIGLAIVKNAIKFHRGEISAKQRKENGLEFIFTLRRD